MKKERRKAEGGKRKQEMRLRAHRIYFFTSAFGLPLSALFILLLAGCGPRGERLETTYGKAGGAGAKSVNGVSVLATMFEEEGYDVMAVTRLTPRLKNVDTIVWAPNDFQPPSEKHRQYFEK